MTYVNSHSASTSTGIPKGSAAMPTAERAARSDVATKDFDDRI